MAAESANQQGAPHPRRRPKSTRSAKTMTPEETFLDDIRVSLQEIEDGHVLDSKQRLSELRAQLKHAKDDC